MDHQELKNSEDLHENFDNLSVRKKIIFINEVNQRSINMGVKD